MAINNNGAGGVQELDVISMRQPGGSFQRPAANDHSVVNLAAVAPAPTDGDSLPVTVADINSGRMVNLPPSSAYLPMRSAKVLTDLPAAPKSNSQLLDQCFGVPSSVRLKSENLV